MRNGSISSKIRIPILFFLLLVIVFIISVSISTVNRVSREYFTTLFELHRSHIESIIRSAGGRDEALRLIREHQEDESITYAIFQDGVPLLSNGDIRGAEEAIRETDRLVKTGGEEGAYGYRFAYLPWRWDVLLVSSPAMPDSVEAANNIMVSGISFAAVLFIIGIMAVVNRNLKAPLDRLIKNLKEGKPLTHTGVMEFDILVDAMNGAFESWKDQRMKTEILHRAAVALNESMSLDDTLKTILDAARGLIYADYAAIALFNEKGEFSKLISNGIDTEEIRQRVGSFPKGKGILRMMQLSLMPVRIDDVTKHEAFSGHMPEGHPVITNFLGYPIFSSKGLPLGSIYFANKITGPFTEEDERLLMAIASDAAVAIQRVSATEELSRFKRIIDSAFDIITFTDQDGQIVYVNKAFEELTGYSKAEVLGRGLFVLNEGIYGEEFRSNILDGVRSGNPWRGELINRKKNGEEFIVSSVIFPIHSDSGENIIFVSIQRDITEEKKLYEQLLRAQKMEAIGTLAGGIAHDFNNILTAVLGYAEVIKHKIRKDDPIYKGIDIIERSAQQGAALAGRILGITRKEKLELKPVDINSIIRETFDILNRSIPKEINIELNLNEGIPPIKADPVQIQQVVMNLAINAKDAMPEGGILRIETDRVGRENGAANGITSEGGFVRLTVSDTGEGIDNDLQSRVFDPFFTTKETGKGTGLGLYIIHSIVTNHGGYINLYSEPGKGTRFNIYFPEYKGDAGDTETFEEDELTGSGLILVIDDDQHIRELGTDLLESLGYTVLTAANGMEGIALFREHRGEIRAVILDMIMPRMSGSEVFQRLQSMDPDVKVVLCSGYSHEGLAGIRELLDSGVKGFVQKPFTRKTIATVLKQVLS
ncbi:MAG: PAS domain S-box protein [Nitrospirae bacterium]|nr:PAS domain S-box protein [Nitrospirota bacterium]